MNNKKGMVAIVVHVVVAIFIFMVTFLVCMGIYPMIQEIQEDVFDYEMDADEQSVMDGIEYAFEQTPLWGTMTVLIYLVIVAIVKGKNEGYIG